MFNLDKYLKEQRKLIDTELNSRMPHEDETPAILHKAMRYSVFSGGKRLRPILCLAAAEATGGNPSAALAAAAAIELLHTYTLIHDDLPCMDDDDFRRGKPSAHKEFGIANAVLSGDALQSMAYEILATAGNPGSLTGELAMAAGSRGVVGGQVEDLAVSGSSLDASTLNYIHTHKTAMLFKAALRMGGISVDAKPRQMEALTDYGLSLGLAFQVTDDLLDGDSDENEGTSCLSLYSRDDALKKTKSLIGKALAALDAFDESKSAPMKAIAESIAERKS